MKILVCGGAGYIGSHMCKMLAEAGHEVTVFDNLSTGHRWAVKWGKLIKGDLLIPTDINAALRYLKFDAIIHFAAHSVVTESVTKPARCYRTNLIGTLNLLEAMRAANISSLVFSSTAAVYGNPQYVPIDENHPCDPINPYGRSKWMIEQILRDYSTAYDLKVVSLRYFNAAGADFNGEIGEAHDPETHLIPNIIKSAVNTNSTPVNIFGDNYDTADGTCVRDYIHVEDLCNAHLKSLEFLDTHSGMHVFNLGTERGYSVKEVVAACRDEFDGRPAILVKKRRQGDPSTLIAANKKASSELFWQPKHGLAAIIRSAIAWHSREEVAEETPFVAIRQKS